jgi:hypothetical protein
MIPESLRRRSSDSSQRLEQGITLYDGEFINHACLKLSIGEKKF